MSTEKDTTLGDLEAYNDVFADIMNVLMFKGKTYVGEDELEQGREKSSYESDHRAKVRPQYRDIHKYWKNCKVRIAYVGLENETEPENDMPLRTIGYDGAAYRDQISYYTDAEGKRRKNVERYPVVTLVLYMGYKKHWDKARTLYEALGENLDARLKPFVNDYKIHLFEIAFLEEKDVQKFKSDFRIVADYLVQMRKNNDYKPAPIQIHHVREVLNAMAALTQDARFEEEYVESGKGDEPKTMSEVLDRIENRGRKAGHQAGLKEGRKAGLKEGRREGRTEMIKLMAFLAANGRSDDIVKAGSDEGFLNQLLLEYQNNFKTQGLEIEESL